ncbi:GNAT family N-acetyltransferase [bacterium]|nr:GNAT family N-acetyltransferase [bacterium]
MRKPDLWGQGYGTETLKVMTNYAFEHSGVERALLNPSKSNSRIIHVNEKCGYRTIGEKKIINGT